MDKAYGIYCIADPVFYDTPVRVPASEEFAISSRPAPDGWERFEFYDWVQYRRLGLDLPPQGWKVHVSATLQNAEEIVAEVWNYCIRQALTFKFIRNRRILLLRNGKSADRSASGKFVTIYPRNEVDLERTLVELGARLVGKEGPYILSDLRWGSGPLYVRYGGFAARSVVAESGELEPAIEDPEGNLVPDRRMPTFAPPDWIKLPAFLEPHLSARNSANFDQVPYQIEGPLHFSNSGGVYRAIDRRNGKQVVIKEARPYAAFAMDGKDAVARLQREWDILERLGGLEAVPAAREYFTAGEHHYLVQDFVEGPTLNTLFVEKYPLVAEDNSSAELAEYANWAIGMCNRVERAVAAVHERGVVIGDINASNVLVRADGEVALVDWEAAQFAGENERASLATPDFAIQRNLRGIDIDRHALAQLRLFIFLPLTLLAGLDPRKVEQFAAEIGELFPCEPDFVREALKVIGHPAPDWARCASMGALLHSADWPELRDSMMRAILASATPNRKDRLFPGDPEQFAPGGGINMAYGAAGVLYALNAVGAGRYPEGEDWLVERALRHRGVPLGFYDGLHGIAYALDQIGRRDDAIQILQICIDRVHETTSDPRLGLFSGIAGVGLNLAYFADVTGDSGFKDAARSMVDIAADRLDDRTAVTGDHAHVGLLRGSSGAALLFIRWFEKTSDHTWLDLARAALHRDLRHCVAAPDGRLYVDEGRRLMGYLADGSVGIAMVIEEYLVHEADEELSAAAAAMGRVARSRFFIQSGLFAGRAGMILHLSRARGKDQREVANQIRCLSWHGLCHQDNLVFPGDQLLRVSMDFATGTSGVMFALAAALHDESLHLPFLQVCGADRSNRFAGSESRGRHHLA